MAHEIFKNDDFIYDANGATPWHRLGSAVDSSQIRDAIDRSSVGQTHAELVPLYQFDTSAGFLEIPDQFGVSVQVGSNPAQIVSTAGKKRRVYQYSELFSDFQRLIDRFGLRIATAGTLRNGAAAYIAAAVPGDLRVGASDAISQYIVIASSHDGTLAPRAFSTLTRPVCANTLAYGLRNSTISRSTKQTRNCRNRMERILRDIGDEIENAPKAAELFTKMAKTKLRNAREMEAVVRWITENPPTGDEPTRTTNRVSRVLDLTDHGAGADRAECRGTLWGAFNAITNYATHEAGRSYANRASSALTNAGQSAAGRVFDRAAAIATGEITIAQIFGEFSDVSDSVNRALLADGRLEPANPRDRAQDPTAAVAQDLLAELGL